MPGLQQALKSLLSKKAVGATKKGKGGKIHYYANSDVLGALKELGRWSPHRTRRL